MILLKREDGFFPEREDLPLLEVTAETCLWYGLTKTQSEFLKPFYHTIDGSASKNPHKKNSVKLFLHVKMMT